MTQKYYKYPRTFHFSWSENLQNDDRLLPSTDGFVGKEIVITEKTDGENTTFYRDHLHARSLDSKDHPSRHWIKSLHAQVKYQIPEGWRVCGENMYALHSVYYTGLPSYFLVFGIYDENNECLSWNDTKYHCKKLGLHTVPEIYTGSWDEETIKQYNAGKSQLGGWQPLTGSRSFSRFRDKIKRGLPIGTFAEQAREGYVVRIAESFPYNEYQRVCAKFVRKDFISATANNWMYEIVIQNKLVL